MIHPGKNIGHMQSMRFDWSYEAKPKTSPRTKRAHHFIFLTLLYPQKLIFVSWLAKLVYSCSIISGIFKHDLTDVK